MATTFVQPSSNVNQELGNKCFAYSTLNALAEKDVALPGISNQAEADDWIKSKHFSGAGGGPGVVLSALNLDPKQYSVKYEKKKLTVAGYASENNLPAVLATTVNGANHWIFFTGTTEDGILGEDQQNTGRGTLNFTLTDGKFKFTYGTYTYVLNSVDVFITESSQRDAINALIK